MSMTRTPEGQAPMAREKKPKEKKPRELYFNMDTHNAIVEYQVTSGSAEREQIFVSRIHPAFEKLAENLINIHRFVGQHDSHDDLKSDAIAFLYESIHKFDPKRGTLAFSYFNVVCAHALIARSKKRTQGQRRFSSLSDPSSLSAEDLETIEHYVTVPAPDDAMIDNERASVIIATLRSIRSQLKTQNEIVCLDSIITLFEMSEDIDILGKSATLTYIRELSGLSPKQLTMAMGTIRRAWAELRARQDQDTNGDDDGYDEARCIDDGLELELDDN